MNTTKKISILFGVCIISFASLNASNNYRQPPNQDNMQRKAPPTEAIEACKSKSENDTCSVSMRGRTSDGVCEYTPDKQYFACRPSDMQMPSNRGSQENYDRGFNPNEEREYVD